MLDLTKEERTLLSAMENTETFVSRQAEDFSLIKNGFYVCKLDTNICKHLIELHCLVEVGINDQSDDTIWLYKADPVIFAPNFEIGEDNV